MTFLSPSFELTQPLLTLFDTDFLRSVLQTILTEVKHISPVVHVGSLDSWPLSLYTKEYAAMIFNTHFENDVGEHWVGVFIDGETQTAYTFDSLPLRPFPQNVLHKLNKICVYVRDINPHHFMLQHPAYPLCGLYCLVFVERFSKKKSLYLCPRNPTLNDITVVKHVLPFIKDTFALK